MAASNSSPPGLYLSPDWLALEKEMGARPAFKGNYKEVRAAFAEMSAAIAVQSPPPDPSVATEDFQVGPEVSVRIFRPKEAKDQKLPVGVYMHGGAYC